MKQAIFTIERNTGLVSDIYEMRLLGDTSDCRRTGQFVNIELPGLYLRRPISVSDYDAEGLTIIYKVVGRGTEQMAAMRPGDKLDLLTGLGNGYSVNPAARRPLLVGGGTGRAPLYGLAKALLAEGQEVSVVLGLNNAADNYYIDRLAELGAKVHVATMDGSMGAKGFVTDAIREFGVEFDYFYACGPMPMLAALCKSCSQPGQVSLEARMGCGFGICMGCSIETTKGSKRVCKEGPIFMKEDLIW